MNKRLYRLIRMILATLLLFSVLPPPAHTKAMDMPSGTFGQVHDIRQTELAPGAVYTWYDMTIPRGQEKVHFLEFDPKNPNLELQAGTKSGKVRGMEGVTEMAAYADKPGNRVIGGINADFFDISGNATGVPNGLFIGEGRILNTAVNSYAYGLKKDGTSLYGSPKLTRTVTIGDVTTNLTHINRFREDNQLVLYTTDYFTSTKTSNQGDEVVLDILEGSVKSGTTLRLKVSEVRRNAGDTPLSEGKVVLSASGSSRPVLENVKAGDEITARFDLEGEWSEVTVAVGGRGPLVKDGVPQTNVIPEGVHPRTALGTKADGSIVLFEVDGRAPGFSEGVETAELARILADLGVVNAINLDGGGSSTFVARMPGEVGVRMMNQGSDGGERQTGNSLLLVNKAPEGPAARLAVNPGMERILKGSSFSFATAALDEAGHPAAWSGTPNWSVDPAIGTVDASGRFTAGSVPAAGRIRVSDGSLQGMGEVEVVDRLTELKLPDEAKTYTTGFTVKLSVKALRDGQVIQASNDSFEWRLEGQIGTITPDGIFTSTSANDQKGRIYVKYGNVETSMEVTVGVPPVMLEDFEGDLTRYKATPVVANYARISLETNQDYVRSGKGALKLDYDFTGKTGTSGAYFEVKSADDRLSVPGYPTKIGMWVYGDGQKHWLRSQFRDGGGKAFAVDLTSAEIGVNWTGWKYVEAPIPAGKTLPLQIDQVVRYMETNNKNKTAGTLYVDDIRVLYGPVTEDRTPPVIKNITPAENAVVKTAMPTITAYAEDSGYDPVKHPGTTLIDPAKIRVYMDGVQVSYGLYPPEGRIQYKPLEPLEDGPHKVKVAVRDMSGNQTIREWSFRVDLGLPKLLHSTPDKVYAGNLYTLDIRGDKIAQLKSGSSEFGFDPAVVEITRMLPGDKLTGNQAAASLDPAAGTVRVDLTGLDGLTLSDEDILAKVEYRVKGSAAGTNVIHFSSGTVTALDGSTRAFYGDALSSAIEHELTLDWDAEGVTESFTTQFMIKDRNGGPVEGARLLLDGVEAGDGGASSQSDARGLLATDAATRLTGTHKVQAVKGSSYSPILTFKVSPLAGTAEPFNISVNMGDEASSSRHFAWHTHVDTLDTVVEVVKRSELASFDSGSVMRFTGTSSIFVSDQDGTVRVHKAKASGLAPDTEYVYRVGDGKGLYSAEGTFRTASATGGKTRFLFFGDSQASDTAGFSLWAATLQKGLEEMPGAELFFHAGDIVDAGYQEDQWNMWYKEAQANLMKATLVPAIGNHEVMGTRQNEDYLAHFYNPENGLESLKGTNFSFDYEEAHYVVLNSEYEIAAQKEWLRKDLTGSTKKWKIVIFHQGPYGSIYDNGVIRAEWTPVFDEFGVDLVMNGHEHVYLRTPPMKNQMKTDLGKGTVYVVGGSSGPKFYPLTPRSWQEKTFAEEKQIFSAVELEGDTLSFTVKTIDGREVDRFVIVKAAPADPMTSLSLTGRTGLRLGDTDQTVAKAVYTSGLELPVSTGLSYASSNPEVAKVNPTGLVTALKEGTTVISAVYQNFQGSYSLTVSTEQPVVTLDRLEFGGLPSEMKTGETREAVTYAVYSDGLRTQLTQGVGYISQKPEVASIDASGKVTASSEGTTVLTAVYGGLTTDFSLTVRSAAPAVTLDKLEIQGLSSIMKAGDYQVAKVIASYSSGLVKQLTEGLDFRSSDPATAEVTADGRIQAHKKGKVAIEVSYEGQTASFALTVTAESTDTENPGGGGSGPVSPPVPEKPEPVPGLVKLDPEKLAASEIEGMKVVILNDNFREIVLPDRALESLEGDALRIQSPELAVLIPAEVFGSLRGLAGTSDLAGSRLSLTVDKVSGAEVERLLTAAERQSGARVEPAGDLMEFGLSFTTKDGKAMTISRFDKPLTIEFKAKAGVDRKLTNLYYVADNGQLTYVGGSWNGEWISAEVTHFSKYSVLQYDRTYADVEASHWASPVIKELSAKQLVEGTGPRDFEPERDVTRAEFTAMLVRLLGLKGPAIQRFADVTAGQWYYEGVGLAAHAGLVQGVSESSFAPDAPIRRQEMAAMIVRAYEYATGRQAPEPAAHPFADTDTLDAWAKEAIGAAKSLALISGRTDSLFEPAGTGTRAESAKLIHGLWNIRNKS
ncbi:phosphodiester glycosidase family protein [Paenibacillus aurantius]|uniref:Phosphodiester glycosidase family protein n=1 Tax=Paenibacillus aurantius TaxID=2918900 RepID=A0AA96RG39_9BACL|nr:phosphodiester glycosidase family protein [Paenibacillus aurantius]WNQ11923.1 phosphodiester glycosidase family protein [Paenibacillus aurantius]